MKKIKFSIYSMPPFMLLALLQLLVTFGVLAQNPDIPPSGNFELIRWKLTLPDQTEIKEQELANGYESSNEFYTDPITGAMVFRCPNDGETGGSTYPRSELREMLRAGNTSISTTGVTLNNWVFSSSSQSVQDAAGAVDGTMTATVAVDHVSTTGESSKVGRVIIGQIHGSNDEPCRLYYRKLPGNSKGSIYFAHEPTTGSEQWYEMIGSRSSSAADPLDGIALGEKFSYRIQVEGNTLTVTIMREGKPDVQRVVDMSASGYANDWMYFKAGNYNQNNTGDPGDYAQVSFFALDVSHRDETVLNITDPILLKISTYWVYPNPSSSSFKIKYELSNMAAVQLGIYSSSGQKIMELLDEHQTPGSHSIDWFPEPHLPNGQYIAELRIDDKTRSFKIILNR